MNNALAPNGVGATEASVELTFMASLQRGFDYSRTNHSGGAVFTFWLIGGAGAATYTRTELHIYNRYSENIRISNQRQVRTARQYHLIGSAARSEHDLG